MKTKIKNADLELLRKLPVSRNKVIVAAILLSVMALMWLKLVLSNRGDNQATVDAAVTLEADMAAEDMKSQSTISYIELPVIEGRNDTLKRDLFMTSNWSSFKALKGAVGKVSVGSGNDSGGAITEDDIAKIESIIKLDGIIASQSSATREAFIENKLVSIGSKVAVTYNNRVLELEVTEIDRNKVVLTWKNFRLEVKMPQAD